MTRILLVAALFLLMGMDGGCAYSENPLSTVERGFADHYLLGRWYDVEFDDSGRVVPQKLAYEVVPSEEGDLIVRLFVEGTVQIVYRGHSTQLDGRKFINLRMIDCTDCDDDVRASLPSHDCPYMIFEYATFLGDEMAAVYAEHISDLDAEALLIQARELRGRLLFVSIMDNDVVEDAAANGLIDADAGCDDCESENDMCIRARGPELARFVRDYEATLYPVDEWGWLIRGSDQAQP